MNRGIEFVLCCVLLSLIGPAKPTYTATVQPSTENSGTDSTSSTSSTFQSYDIVSALDTFHTPICKSPQSSPVSMQMQGHGGGTEDKPSFLCPTNGVLNQEDLKNVQFLGFHGTIVAYIKSLEKGARVVTKGESLKHGPGFYVSDSLSASRMYSTLSHQTCAEHLESIRTKLSEKIEPHKPPEWGCEPSMCAIFASKSFWSQTPKVNVKRFYRFTDGSLQLLYWRPERTRQAVQDYMSNKRITTRPILCSPMGPDYSHSTQCVFSAEHAKNLVAVCTYDSVGAKIARKYSNGRIELIPSLPISTQNGIESTFGGMFGESFKDMLRWNYRNVMQKKTKDKVLGFDVIGLG
ncbi:hypothetical protein BKA69DRAFT_687228 [Paraphysoderma sedebokerense]|nr:hypothetical protein BKA69DRAFT_687228 [Paraphysoderma sedebokerense]